MTAAPIPSALPPTCAAQARAVEEPLPGTGPEAVGWIVVEQPGPWGRDAVLDSGLDRAIATVLDERVADLPVRLQIVRRPGHRRSVQRAVLLAHAGERPWLRRLALADTKDLLDLDPACVLSPDQPAVGEPEPGPAYLVCTHAKRDQCCALWGRPVVEALADERPQQVWESSHVGGHRFAGNLVVLPYGLTYGYLEPDDGMRIVAATERGQLEPRALRGRSSLPRAAQAAEVFARQHTGELGIGDLRVLAVDGGDDGDAHVSLEVAGARYLVHVRSEPLGSELLTGCDKDAPKDPGAFSLVSIVAG